VRHPLARVLILLLLGIGSCLAGCGREEPAPPPPGGPKGASAFRLAVAAHEVEHSIPLEFFRNGIGKPDPRDVIPALFDPQFAAARDVRYLPDEARVIVLEIERDARAYPLAFLDRHELVNDLVGGVPVLISWCPLCGSSVVYEREVEGQLLTFGVSGYLYRSDVLMYDHQTESFWSQLHQGAVAGPQTGTPLTVIPSRVTSLDAFRRERPAGKVLRGGTGMLPPAAYGRSPYAGYADSPRIWFPVGTLRDDLPPKAEVIGLAQGGDSCAFPLDVLARAPEGVTRHVVGGKRFTLLHDAVGRSVSVRDDEGTPVAATRLFWFAWQAFHPRTRVFAPR